MNIAFCYLVAVVSSIYRSLLLQVSDQLQARINVGVRRNNTNLLDLMKDAHKARRLQQDRNDLSSLTKALDEMNTI